MEKREWVQKVKNGVSYVLSVALFIVILYGAYSEFFIPQSQTGTITVFGEDAVALFPDSFEIIPENQTTFGYGIQNGISLSGELIWDGLKLAWSDYRESSNLIWIIVGLPITLIKWFFIMIPVYFVMIYKLSLIGGLAYKISLILSSLLPFGLLAAIGALYEEE